MYRPLRSQRAKAFPRRASCLVFLIFASALTILFTLSLPAPRAYAATYTVTTCADNGSGSLRQAILDANANPGADTISFILSCNKITLASNLPGITGELTITGPGAGALAVDGAGSYTVFVIESGAKVDISGLTIQYGYANIYHDGWLYRYGGGIYTDYGAKLTVSNSAITNNESPDYGGGIGNWGTLTLSNSTVSGNFATEGGGGIYTADGTLTLINSTISDNSTNGVGGAIDISYGTIVINRSTITNNFARYDCGAISNDNDPVSIRNSIVANNSVYISGANICGSYSQQGSNILSGDPKLGPLQNNGGPTQTRQPQPGSPAIDAAPDNCPATDQRGRLRPIDGNGDGNAVCDIGAVEMGTPVLIQSIGRVGPTLTNASSVVFNVTFSGPVTGLSAGNFSLTSLGPSGTSISDVSGSGAAWAVTVNTGSGNGPLWLDMVNANGLSGPDYAPVWGVPFTRGDGYVLDKTVPTVTINQASAQADPTNATPIRFDVKFSENVFSFDASDIGLTGTAGATTATVSGGNINYTVEVSGMTGDGTVIASINPGAASDQAGNASAASTSADNTVEYDTTAPTVVLSSTAPNPTNGPVAVAVSFSEDVTGFEAADVSISNGTVTGLSGSGAAYTFTVTPSADGLVTIDIPGGVASDAAGNGNTVATQLTRTYDGTPPTVMLSTAAPNPTNAAFTVSVSFSEPVTGFSASSIAILNGTLSSFSGSGTSYGFTVTPGTDGEVTVIVPPGAVSDATGNTNLAVIPLTRTFDATAPNVTLSSAAPDPTNAPISVTATFSESVTGFDASDVTVTNGALSAFAGSGASYSFTVMPAADGLVTVGIAPGVAFDAAGNGNTTAATELRRVFDATAPSITLSSTAPDPTNAPFSVTITFGQDVSDFEASDVTITNGTLSDFTGSGTSYSFTVTPGGDGLVTIDLANGVAHDAAGNPNPAAQLTRTFDATAPTVTVEQGAAQADPTTTAPILFTVTFSENVTGFDDSDLLLGGTAGATTATGSGGPAAYTVEVSGMTAFGTVTAEVSAGAAIDAAGNVSLASTSADNTVTFIDTNAPGVLVDPVALALLENGPAQSYTVRLNSQPLVGETVTVDVAPSSTDASASPAALSFDRTNWDLPQTVSVSAVDNTLADGTRTVSIAHTVASSDPSTPYGAGTVTAPSVDLTLQDDDTPGLLITETNGSTAVTEGGAADSYTVALTMQPAAGDTVTLTLTFDATWLAVTPASLTFDTSTWDTPQTVTVTAVDNLTVGDGPATVQITHTASSALASPYQGLTADLIVQLADNDILFVGDPVPLCADFDGSTSAVVRATVPPGAVTNGGVYCHSLVEDGSYVKGATAASIGHPEMVSGVWQAVDVYGMAGPYSYTQFNGSVEVCLKGAGRLLFLDASTQPRSLSVLSAREASGYTCANLPGAGTVSLVQGAAPSASGAPAADPASPPNSGSAVFGECAVTTRAILNLREAPSADATVAALVPFDVTLTAFERSPGWFYVDYLGLRGWLSAAHVTPRGDCGQ